MVHLYLRPADAAKPAVDVLRLKESAQHLGKPQLPLREQQQLFLSLDRSHTSRSHLVLNLAARGYSPEAVPRGPRPGRTAGLLVWHRDERGERWRAPRTCPTCARTDTCCVCRAQGQRRSWDSAARWAAPLVGQRRSWDRAARRTVLLVGQRRSWDSADSE